MTAKLSLIKLVSLVCFTYLSLLAQASDGSDGGGEAKAHFKNLSPEERLAYLSRAEVLTLSKTRSLDKISSVDVAAELQQRCGGPFTYLRKRSGLEIPTVECKYVPATGEYALNGQSRKFLCAFQDGDKEQVVKVKYAISGRHSRNAESQEAVLGMTFARLIGFEASTACPARVVCRGCPSNDPWKDANRSSATASNNSHTFEITSIEYKKVEGLLLFSPSFKDSPGFAWSELEVIDPKLSFDRRREIAIQREALLLWNVLLHNKDAVPANQSLVCRKWESSGVGGPPACTDSAVLTYDYGYTFGSLDLVEYRDRKIFLSASADEGCVGDLNENTITYPRISEEARKLLLERLEEITRQQMVDIFQLAQVTTSGHFMGGWSVDKWIDVFQEKIDEIRQARCKSIM